MSINKYLEALGAPFPANKVKWRIQSVTDPQNNEGYAVPYLDSRTIAERLDSVVGQMRWRDEYKPWASTKEGASQLCTIYVYDDELKEWIGKTDAAGMSRVEPVKVGISDAFKRAAVKWNIGRYLYNFSIIKVKTAKRGSSVVVAYSEYPRLCKFYNETLQKLGISEKPAFPANSSNPAVPMNPTNNPDRRPAAPAANGQPMYEILGVRQQPTTSGMQSILEIGCGGKKVTAYYNGTDNKFQRGARLGRAKFTQKATPIGKVNILTEYEMAA